MFDHWAERKEIKHDILNKLLIKDAITEYKKNKISAPVRPGATEYNSLHVMTLQHTTTILFCREVS